MNQAKQAFVEVVKYAEDHDALLNVGVTLLPEPPFYSSTHESVQQAWDEATRILSDHGITLPPLSEMDVESDGDEHYVSWETPDTMG
jgi:hypothetical protein